MTWVGLAVAFIGQAAAAETPEQYLGSLDGTGFTGVVQVLEGDRVAHQVAAGQQLDGSPIDENSLFWIGSITKHLASVAVLREVEQGRVDLDREVAAYFEELSDGAWSLDGEPCTVRRILSHRCGLPRDWKDVGVPQLDEDDPESVRQFLEVAGTLTPRFVPGSEFEYSNMGFQVAGLLVARTRGQPFEQVLQELVAEAGVGPLTTRPGASHGYPDLLAPGTVPLLGNWLSSETWLGIPRDFGRSVGAAGNALSTAAALGLWFRTVVRGELLGEESQHALLEPHLDDYALGVVVEKGPPPYAWHNGALSPFGYSSFVAHLPETDSTVVVLCNQYPSAVSVNDIGFDLVDLLVGKAVKAPDEGGGLLDSMLTLLLMCLTTMAIPVILLFGAFGKTGARLNWALGFSLAPWVTQQAGAVMGVATGLGVVAAGLAGMGLGLWRRRNEPRWDGSATGVASLVVSLAIVAFIVQGLGGGWLALAWAICGALATLAMERTFPPRPQSEEPLA